MSQLTHRPAAIRTEVLLLLAGLTENFCFPCSPVQQSFAHQDFTCRDIHLDPDYRRPAEPWDLARWVESDNIPQEIISCPDF